MARYVFGFLDLFNRLKGTPGAPLEDETFLTMDSGQQYSLQVSDNGLMLWSKQGNVPLFIPAHDDPAPPVQRDVIGVAEQWIGLPYQGPLADMPELTRWPPDGFDCSSYVAASYGLATGGHIDRSGGYGRVVGAGVTLTAYTDRMFDELGPAANPRRGDVIFYSGYEDGQAAFYKHVGLWGGNGRTLECRFPDGVGWYRPLDVDRTYRRPRGW